MRLRIIFTFGCLLVFLFTNSSPAEEFRAQQLESFKVSTFDYNIDKSQYPAPLASELAQLHKLYSARGNFAQYAGERNLKIIGESVTVSILPESGFSIKSIAQNLAQYGAIIEAQATNSMRCRLPINRLREIAANVPGIKKIGDLIRPVPDAVAGEGIVLMNADAWQTAGFNGAGVKVAVVDGGFMKLSDAQANGDIPPTYYGQDYTGSGLQSETEHGTAVTEAIYEIAPGADFSLYHIGDMTDLELAKNDLVSRGVDVVNHSMSWFMASYYDGTGPVSSIVADAIAHDIVWCNSAGNSADSHYRAVFDEMTGGFHDMDGLDHYLNLFGPGPGYVWLFPRPYILRLWMNWDAYPTTSQDYDLYLYRYNDATSTWSVVASSTNRQNGATEPVESITYVNTVTDGKYAFAVKKYNATTNVDFTVFTGDPIATRVYSSSITDPGVYEDVVTVGAISSFHYANGPQEDFSGQGPTTDGRAKPNVAGPDSCNSFAYGYWQGTSLSSPYAAGVSVLIRARFPAYNEAQARNYLYTECVADLGAPGFDYIYGHGKVLLPDVATASITVTAPNGGESWMVGATETITWTSSGASAAVNLDYSTNNGASWTPIVAGTANDGSHDWTIPNAPSALCLVRATDADGSPADASDAVFIIVAVPDPVGDLVASVLGENILLEWSPQAGVTTYNVYRGTSYNFVPDFAGGLNRIGTNISDQDAGTAGVQWTDTGNGADVVGDLANNYFYRVTGTPGVETAASNLAGEFDRQFLTTAGTDINELVVIFDTQNGSNPLLTAENLAQAIPNCTDVYQWIATGQGQVGHPKGTPINNFALTAGYPYIVNVSANTIWTNAGAYIMPSFGLITTTGTDINHIGLPFEKSALTTAEALGDDITSCTDVYYWDVTGQGHVGHPVNTPVQNFGVTAGLPYYVNVTSASTWPAGGAGAPQFVDANDLTKRAHSIVGRFGGNVPHTVYGRFSAHEIQTGLQLRAWIAGRENEVLTDNTIGTGFDHEYWWVSAGNFATRWSAGEQLHIELTDAAGVVYGSQQVILTNAGSDLADEIQLGVITSLAAQTDVPDRFELLPNYPNPFNPSTTLRFGLPALAQVKVTLYAMNGRLIRTLVDAEKNAGYHDVVWDGRDEAGALVSSGVYLCRVESGDWRQTIKLVFAK